MINFSGDIIERSKNSRFIKYNKRIGRGSFKDVYLGFDTLEGKDIAWNLISINGLSDKEKKSLSNEIKILQNLNNKCEFVINYYNSWFCQEENSLILITEIALSGTLKQYVGTRHEIRLGAFKKWCNQIMEAINFLHKQNIVHRDIKSDNIFINSNTGNIILGDLGLSLEKTKTDISSIVGTPEFMAPELYEGLYSDAIDIYSFGLTMLELLTKETPYSECKFVPQIWKSVVNNKKPESFSCLKESKLKNIIEKCISFDPKNRPKINNLLEISFFKDTTENDKYINLFLLPNKFRMVREIISDILTGIYSTDVNLPVK